jgi:hypothetical protein
MKTALSPAPYTLLLGASWLAPGGEVVPIAGFHEEWLREHEEIAEGARNVCELVLRRRWLSIALFAEGYLELMVPDRNSDDVRRSIYLLLSRNAGNWSKALVMSMDAEGYAMLAPADAADETSLAAALARTI